MEQETIDTGNTIKTSHLLIGLAFILFIVGSVVYGLWNRNPDRSEWVRGTAQVIETFYGRTGGRKYVYKVNGKTYTAFAGRGFTGNCTGDVYEILINPGKFEDSYLLNDRPLFMEDEAIGETIGELQKDVKISTNGKYKEAFPLFEYHINGKKYIRVQKIKVPIDSSLVLQKGMKFRVRYWIQNPQRSILDYE
jgi:hypothetical protein